MYAPAPHRLQSHRRAYPEPDWSGYDEPPSPPAAYPTNGSRLASRSFASPPPSPAASRDPYGNNSNAPPVSRLQLMQARFQKRLLQEKEEKMLQLYQDTNRNPAPAAPQRGPMPGQGGAVRQFFAQRRAALQNGGPPIPPPVNLNGSINGGQPKVASSLNGSWTTGTFVKHLGPKQGSPVGWDKSYPLSPLDRDSSGGSSSGYDSGNSFGSTVGQSPYLGTNFGGTRNLSKSHNGNGNGYGYQRPPAAPAQHKAAVPAARTVRPSRRTPSLDRRAPGTNGAASLGSTLAGMRRSNSQIITSGNQRDPEAENYPPRHRSRPVQQVKSSESMKTTPPARRPPPPNNLPLISSKPPPGPPPLSYDSPDGVHERRSPPQQNTRGKKPLVPAISSSPKPPSGQHTPTKPAKTQQKPASRTVSSADPNLSECHICGRRFAKDRIEKHIEICQKAATKKRKVFDPTKMRMKGTELEEFVRKSGKSLKRTNEQKEAKKLDWRQKRENFIEAMREAKAAQRHLAAGGKLSDLPAPKPMDTSDYIQCPHCSRKFSEGAAERHIPKCKNIKSNKKN